MNLAPCDQKLALLALPDAPAQSILVEHGEEPEPKMVLVPYIPASRPRVPA